MLWTTFLRQRTWQTWLYPWRGVDWILFGGVWALTLIGAMVIHSVELNKGTVESYQHLLIAVLGTAIALGLARFNYQSLLTWHWAIYGLSMSLLLAVLFVGVSANGAERWITIGQFNIQPSEFAKVAIILTQAAFLHRHAANTLKGILQVLAVTAPPFLLIMMEPDLGTALVFVVITLAMFYWANAKAGWIILMVSPLIAAILFALPLPWNLGLWLWLLWTVGMGIVGWHSLPLGWMGGLGAMVLNLSGAGFGQLLWRVLKDYQKDRILMFLDPHKDPLGGGYHLIQSRIAIGAGGVFGQGLHQGTQTQLGFIPEQHTDFIFSAIGEEWGFVGGLIVLILYWIVCVRLLQIANSAREDFGSLIAIGMLAVILFQTVVNIGMTMGLSPVTGIPLPWISYGRSAMLANYITLGFVLSVANHRPRQRY
ncbi:rod shape-determining protein RodA [Candidatus Synechococcus calcipolaris G9]|uniref:Peptidoglycan glycosyltransferase RodA n=1 Tax=Candidatus Synechococcus calcipolaris G9 TaxID=1497997 RepID=A0ABT6F1R8_9SYNE|nr:rod shape-determining protein RodA [Candidatus Synechococcus calcipolaris]MDG2991809.1 rod shape-determining protein RodA [Candidatus Synechococcus calcipolaris G9]